MVSPDFIVGIIGNVISVLLCAAPAGAFWELVKRRSAENYNALPYITGLLAKSLWAFYGTLDPDGLLIVTVNSIGVFSQLIYVLIYLIFAPTNKKIKALVLVGILNIGIPGPVIAVTLIAFHGTARYTFIGILCAVVTIAMYAAPLSVMRAVIKTNSVECMPFPLSFFLLLNAGAWFTFAMIQNDYYVIAANAVGILSSSAQLIIYVIYMDKSCSSVISMEMMNEDGSIHPVEVDIKVQDLNENVEEGKMENRIASFPKESLSRDNSFRKMSRTFSSAKDQLHSNFILVP